MNRAECLDLFSRLPLDGYIALDETGVILDVCLNGDRPFVADDWRGRYVGDVLELRFLSNAPSPDWREVIANGPPPGTRLTINQKKIMLKPEPIRINHPDDSLTLFIVLDRCDERYHALLHRLKGYLHLMGGYFHLRENDSTDDIASSAFCEARALVSAVSALNESYRHANGATLFIPPSAVVRPMIECFSGKLTIQHFFSEQPAPVRFVEKAALWLHQILALLLSHSAQTLSLEWQNDENGCRVALSGEKVDWVGVVDDATHLGELARAYLADLSGQYTVVESGIAAVFPFPPPYLARI
jgi:hypothetical protein